MFFKFFLVLFSICLPIFGILRDTLNESKIISGSATRIEDAPYMAFFKLNDYLFCGGSIMNKNQILTAAHCAKFVDLNNPKIEVGSASRGSFTQNFDIAKIQAHPDFDEVSIDYDAAVVTINGTFEFSQSVAPIALVDKDYNLPEGAPVKIQGWGVTDKGSRSCQLLEVIIPIVSQDTCIKEYANITVKITKNMVCAGIAEKDACHGDSGGPMTYNGKVAGIISFGEGCGLPGFPGVYTRVSAIRSWLDTVLA